MLNNILSDIQKILRGKNGTVFFVILGLLAVIFFLKALPSLIGFLIVAAIVFLIFKYFENKED
jgi:large-conductance mechanosensitive channel